MAPDQPLLFRFIVNLPDPDLINVPDAILEESSFAVKIYSVPSPFVTFMEAGVTVPLTVTVAAEESPSPVELKTSV